MLSIQKLQFDRERAIPGAGRRQTLSGAEWSLIFDPATRLVHVARISNPDDVYQYDLSTMEFIQLAKVAKQPEKRAA